jgi:hypothetical protein
VHFSLVQRKTQAYVVFLIASSEKALVSDTNHKQFSFNFLHHPVGCDTPNLAMDVLKQSVLHKISTQRTEQLLKAKLCASELGFTSFCSVLTSFLSDLLLPPCLILGEVMARGVA